MSPESIVRIGGNVASNTPSRTVSFVDSTVWTRPTTPVALATGAGMAEVTACASFAKVGPTAASAAMKLLARNNCRRARPRAAR